jgi:hypothetical protein
VGHSGDGEYYGKAEEEFTHPGASRENALSSIPPPRHEGPEVGLVEESILRASVSDCGAMPTTKAPHAIECGGTDLLPSFAEGIAPLERIIKRRDDFQQ